MDTAVKRERQQSLVGLLPAAALLTMMVLLPLIGVFPRVALVSGLILGTVIGFLLSRAKAVRGDWGWVIFGTVAAQFASPLLTIIVQTFVLDVYFPSPGPPTGGPFLGGLSSLALFVGGCFGGLVMVGILAWRQAGFSQRQVIGKSLIGLLSGGVLAVIASALAPTIGNHIWYALNSVKLAGAPGPNEDFGYGPANLFYSLFLLWPTGIAFVMALTLHRKPAAD